mgnify:CR=1 FL=1
MPQVLALSGSWTARGMGRLTSELDTLAAPAGESWVIDASGIEALDTAGAWILQTLLRRLRDGAADTRTLASLPDVPDAESLAGLLEDLAAHGLIRRLD